MVNNCFPKACIKKPPSGGFLFLLSAVKIPALLLCLLVIGSCKPIPQNIQPASSVPQTALHDSLPETSLEETWPSESEYYPFYIVTVADGDNFDSLKLIAGKAAELLKIKFDMLGRIYDKKKGIVLPEDAEDEMYSGAYYPRRPLYDTTCVSIEPKFQFKSRDENISAESRQMTVVALVSTRRGEADTMLGLLLPHFPTARMYQDSLYLGCMH